MTQLISGATNNFAIFFLMRFLMGVLQSANNPVSFTLLSDTFPKKMRSRVNSVQNSGIYLGGALSSFSVILIKWLGWR